MNTSNVTGNKPSINSADNTQYASGKRQSILAAPSIWMINNPIASSVLTIALLLFGLLSFNSIVQETSPSFKINEIIISADYPGASPQDIEQSIILPIEHQLQDNADIDRISANAYEGYAEITLSLMDHVNPDTTLASVKNSVDSISSFPGEMEQPSFNFAQELDSIVEIALHGHLPELSLYNEAQKLKKALITEIEVAKIAIQGARDPEIIIELNHEKLLKYQLTLSQVLDKVKASVNDVPTGSIYTTTGELLILTKGKKQQATAFNTIEIITDADGHRVTLADIATVTHGFYGEKRPFLVNNEPSLALNIFQNTSSKPLTLSRQISDFISQYQQSLPAGMSITLLQDASEPYAQRVNLLTSNGIIGMVLILIALSLFIDLRLAFWVSMGIPIAIIGSLGFMPLLNIPINMITLFAFVMTLGILVDDAVIVAENIYQKIQQGVPTNIALKQGVSEMALPVMFSVTTNIIAFVPLLFVPGELGVMYKPMTLLIVSIFIVSLIEALFILPLHLRNLNKPLKLGMIAKVQRASFKGLNYVKNTLYAHWLHQSCQKPISTLVIFISLLLVIFSWVYSGRIDASFVPKIESTRIDAEVEFPVGTPLHDKKTIIASIKKSGVEALTSINGQDQYLYHMQEIDSSSGSSTFMILPEEQRDFTAKLFVDTWRKKIGKIPGVKSIFFDYQVGPGGGKELAIELGHANAEVLTKATNTLMAELTRVSGITDIDSELIDGKLQYTLIPNNFGQHLGFTSDWLGEQMRLHFYGGEAVRQIINSDEVKVRVMLAKKQHHLANQLNRLIITSPSGEQVELGQVATIHTSKAPTNIHRVDGVQLVEVTASILRQIANASLVMNTIEDKLLINLQQQFPQLSIEMGGEARIESKVNAEIIKGIALAFSLIFALLAIIFRSYADAVLVLLVIPFCLGAAILGHMIMGYPFSVMSLFGMIALSGLVINGAFVMRLTIKNLIREGITYQQAITQAALNRFRPVVLTAATTAIGLFPMLFETSTQALYLVPMIISLSFGSLFSIATILLLSPALFTLAEGYKAK